MLKTKRIYDRPSIDDATTRALSEGEGNAISASFEKNDEVVVVDADGSTIVGTLKAQSEGPTTTLTGTLDAKSLTAGEVVTLRYRSATANYDGKWYTGTKKANLANGKNYATSVTLTQLPALTSSSDVGTIGVVDGLPAIVVEINSMKKAVALMNAGALCPEHYGAYYTFTNRTSELTGSWYVPTKDELEALAAIGTKVWGAQNGVNGCSFTIGGNTLFLPAAGYIDNDPYDGDSAPMLSYVSTYGYYWSSTSYNDDLAFILRFSNTTNTTATDYIINGLTVRPFHTLPSPATTRTATL